ncbi:MAG: PAS domain-containing protein [Pseudomonadota bacterium]
MSESSAPPSPAAPPSAGWLAAWLAQSHDLLALTDAAGRIRWCNPAFERTTGLQAGADLLTLAAAGTARDALAAGMRGDAAASAEFALRGASGTPLWIEARVSSVDADRLWTLRDTTALHEHADHAQHLSELLDMAQESGRLGAWEREIPSGRGRWDRHVFGFWGMTPTTDTPDFLEAANRVHPDDRLDQRYLDSTRQAGRYMARYRVIHPDGSMRRIQSQWEVKNGPDGVPVRAIGFMFDDTDIYDLARSLDTASAQLRLAAELADIVIWRHDLQTDRLHYNEHGFKVLGIPYRAEGLSLAEARAWTHPDDVAKLAASAEQSLRTAGPVDVQTRHRWPDGSWRDILVRRVVERDAAGQPRAFLGVSLDITAQVERTRRAEELSRRLEAAARAARIGIWTTRFGDIRTEWNDQMYALFDTVDPSRPPTLAEWIERSVHPDDRERVGKAARQYLREASGSVELEFRSRRRDGTTRWMVLRADVDRADPGAPRVFGIAMDVTERHEARDALHAAAERAALIARHAGIGTWETDAPGLPTRWDAQMWRLRGLEPRPVGMARDEWLDLVHPDDRARLLAANPDTDISPHALAYEFRVRLPDGSYRWLASRSATLQDPGSGMLRRVGVNWDVTDARNAEIARQQVLLAERESEAKSQFLSRMSHELRTPLNAVLGFTQLLQQDASERGASAQSAKLDHIRAAGEHLLTLIDDALDLSSLHAGELRLDLQTVSVAAAATQALPLVESLAAAHGVHLRCGPLAGEVRADPTRLRQVLLNLLTNAIKYNRARGQVIVESRIDRDLVHLSVRDTGRGLSADQLAHLFEPFNRLGMEREGIEGSGIGLTIVKALVEGMGGQIEVTSRPGSGTLFAVALPTAQPLGMPRPDEPAARPAGAPRRRSGQLLYIEDNSVNVLLVEELVKSLSGLRIVSESTGATGVARAHALRPDLILVDLHLPDIDGYEVLRQLRSRPETAAIPCIALSANAMPDDIARGLASGFDDYWTKPIRFKPFLDALSRRFPASVVER